MYLNGRIIGLEEAYWKLMGFPVINIEPATEKIPVHLPEQNLLDTNILNTIDSNNIEEIQKTKKRIERNQNTKLTAFFLI